MSIEIPRKSRVADMCGKRDLKLLSVQVNQRLLGQVLRVPMCAHAAVRGGREHDGGGGGGGGGARPGLHHAHAPPHQPHLQHGESAASCQVPSFHSNVNHKC